MWSQKCYNENLLTLYLHMFNGICHYYYYHHHHHLLYAGYLYLYS